MSKTPFDQQFARFLADFDVHHSVLLTPNKRLSRFFVDVYARSQTAKAFDSIKCLALNTWVQQRWSDLEFLDNHPWSAYTILSSFQENLLWEKVLEQHPDTPALINHRATARQAQDAWRLMHEWQLDAQELARAARTSNDPFIFQGWYQAFERICEQKKFLSSVCIPDLLTKRLFDPLLTSPLPGGGTINTLQKRITELKLPQKIFLYGFDELNPAITNLFNSLENLGIKISTLDFHVDEHTAERIEFVNEQQELDAVARWAKEKITQYPGASIAVVVPNLIAQRSRIERVFMREFEPQYIFPDQAQHATGFNISAGQALAQLPLIHACLIALGCQAEHLPLQHLSALLRSPFIGSWNELKRRATLDIELHNAGELEFSFQQFKTLISEHTLDYSRESETEKMSTCDLYQRVSEFDLLRKQYKNATRYPSEWCSVFIEQLKAWGWPGNRQLDTLEFQQVQRWKDTLEEFSGLDYLLGRISHGKALDVLTLALQQAAFHAQTLSSPLQILGLLEAAGLPFDFMWIMGLDDDTWPPAAQPNPLLPLSIQRHLNLPQSSPEREFYFAQRLTQRLARGSVQLITSSVALKGDKQLSASPLIKDFPLVDFILDATPEYEQILFASRQMETRLDYCGPQIRDLESIRGGSQILKSQATCPFQAFARYRLHTSEIPVPGIGLHPMERGNLLHRVMEIIWRVLREQSQLLAFSDEKLLSIINRATAQALMDIRQKRIAGHRFLQLETQRLSTQVLQWLQLEKQRAPFKVLFNEGRKTVKLEKMPIHIRYDRVDELEDGSLVVLDYKTGQTSIRDWSGARPNEPQVPLYAIANAKRVAGAAFGQISADSVAFIGIANDDSIAPGLLSADALPKMDLPGNWPDILQHWETVLSRLAREFVAGSASVDPKNPTTSCRYCELHTLCRIREQFDFDANHQQHHDDFPEGLTDAE